MADIQRIVWRFLAAALVAAPLALAGCQTPGGVGGDTTGEDAAKVQQQDGADSSAEGSDTQAADDTAPAANGDNLDPDNPSSPIYLGTGGELAGTGSADQPVSEAWQQGMSKRPEALQGKELPRDKFGLIDWMELVNKDYIDPVGKLGGGGGSPPMDLNVVIEAKGNFVDDVVFRHKTHTYWLSCDSCHTRIFKMQAGANPMTMAEITDGEWCGRCHSRVAFPLTDCSRCHSKPKGEG